VDLPSYLTYGIQTGILPPRFGHVERGALIAQKKGSKRHQPILEQNEGSSSLGMHFEGSDVYTRIAWWRCMLEKDDSKVRSSSSNTLKALLGRKRQFEEPKPCLEYLEGTVGPKKAIRGTEALPRIS
jgi:hypothetical protein